MSEVRLCGAKTRAGGTCRRPAMRGTNRCDFHGGKSPQVQAKIVRNEEEAHIRTLLERLGKPEPIGNLIDELLALAAEVREWQRLLRERVGELRDLATFDFTNVEREKAVVVLYERSLDRTARLLTDMAKLDLEARRDEMNHADAQVIAQVFLVALADPGWALPLPLQEKGQEVIAHLLTPA